jgi:uncharacterized protein YqfA (UPF0365 family)
MAQLRTYQRELKKGYTFHLSNGDVIQRTYDHEEPDGISKTWYQSASTNERRLTSHIRDIDDLMIAGQVHKFVPTEEEAEAQRAHVQAKAKQSEAMDAMYSRAHVKQMLEGMTKEEIANFISAVDELKGDEKVLEPAETKVIEPEETKEVPAMGLKKGCPDCGGPIRGKGFSHKADCPRKK